MESKEHNKWKQAMNENRVYAFDIDGIIVENNYPDYDKAKPIQKNIDIINKLYDEGNLIVLNTARGFLTGINWKFKTEIQMNKYGVKYHHLYLTKPAANFYIDDRNINIEEIKL